MPLKEQNLIYHCVLLYNESQYLECQYYRQYLVDLANLGKQQILQTVLLPEQKLHCSSSSILVLSLFYLKKI